MRRRPVIGHTAIVGGAIVATVLCLMSVLVLPIVADPSGAHMRHAKARADVRALAGAVAVYAEHMERLPVRLDDLTLAATSASGRSLAPLLSAVPVPPVGWSGYHYAPNRDGFFVITATGEGRTVHAPER